LNVIIDPVKKYIIHIIIILMALSGCEISQKEVKPQDSFLKIYNHPDEILSFYPESVVELSGGGYIFISAVKDETSEIEYPYTYLVRTDATGVTIWSQAYDWLAPASEIFLQGNSVGFVAMDPQLNAFVLLVDPGSGEITGQHDLEMTMPLSAYRDQAGNLVVLGYDFVSRSSWISRFNGSFGLERSNKIDVNTDLELMIQRHLNKTGQEFPFFVGEYSTGSGTGYYVSCFSNYTLRTLFLDISSLNATGDIFSFQTDEAISSVIHKSGSLFSLTGYYEGNNYIVPETEINVNTSQSIKEFPAEQLYELTHKAKVKSTLLESGGERYTLFASQTNTNSILIYQHSLESDSLINTHFRHFDQKVEVADIIRAEDGGVAILAGIHILGKYQRPLLIKEPEEMFVPEEE